MDQRDLHHLLHELRLASTANKKPDWTAVRENLDHLSDGEYSALLMEAIQQVETEILGVLRLFPDKQGPQKEKTTHNKKNS